MSALKPKGYIIISLPNKYGRFMLEIGRWVFRLTITGRSGSISSCAKSRSVKNSIPRIKMAILLHPITNFLNRMTLGPLDHLLSQLGLIFAEEREGGFFLTRGEKVSAQS
jgi:hypothetical protein